MIPGPGRAALRLVAIVVSAASTGGALAQGFAALVSPPRFELAAKPGTPVRDALKAESCRPWVAIERREITVSPGGKYRYRFEVSPPADAKPGECRFAVLIEGDEQNVQTPGGPSFPIAGRLGVIVYVTVGESRPELSVVGGKVALVEQQQQPVILVKNGGNAHGRLTGFLDGTDAAGKKLEFTPSTLPILPGETRAIPLVVHRDREQVVPVTYPITIRGKLEWADKTTPFEQTFSR